MNGQFTSWSRRPHQGDAACVDHHLPHNFLGKYVAKAANGYRCSKGFTLQASREAILIKPQNADILQANCACYRGDFVHDALLGSWAESIDCSRQAELAGATRPSPDRLSRTDGRTLAGSAAASGGSGKTFASPAPKAR